jgi:hypothetical protein
MAEPTVQVAVSLIRKAAELLEKHYGHTSATASDLRALLSHRTPTAQERNAWDAAVQAKRAGRRTKAKAVHFAPYGSSAASDGTLLPRSTRWDVTTGEYQEGEPFTVKRDRTTCPECRAHFTDETPGIEDFEPWTTFTADRLNGHLVAEGGKIVRRHRRRFMKLVFGADAALVNDMGELVDADEIDPSTIRDVAMPPCDRGEAQ